MKPVRSKMLSLKELYNMSPSTILLGDSVREEIARIAAKMDLRFNAVINTQSH